MELQVNVQNYSTLMSDIVLQFRTLISLICVCSFTLVFQIQSDPRINMGKCVFTSAIFLYKDTNI